MEATVSRYPVIGDGTAEAIGQDLLVDISRIKDVALRVARDGGNGDAVANAVAREVDDLFQRIADREGRGWQTREVSA